MVMTRLFVALVLLCSATLFAQAPIPPPDITLDAAARARVIDGALKALNDAYVFPEVAAKMESAIRARQQRKEYEGITSGRQLAQLLTTHLREVSRDKHLGVNFAPQPQGAAGPAGAPPTDPQAMLERQRVVMGRQNFGFMRLERLAGNIGYVDFRAFMPPAVAGETATAAMNFLAGTDAVIFDMRQNGGGDPAMVAFITSYLFGPQPVHLNDFYFRPTNETRPSWTLPHVPGRRFTGKDVYVLTSARTFSGAEEFTYNLKHLKRATVVGETTGGGAHLVSGRRIDEHFSIGVPSGRPINAITKADWEGVGVEPDVKVPADDALKTAHMMALEKQQQMLPADATGLRNEVRVALEGLRSDLGRLTEARAATESAPPTPASAASDGFESGNLANWRVDRRGAGGWFVYTDGRKPPEPAQSDPNLPFNVPNPPYGMYAAVTDMNGPGRRILYRDVTLDGRFRLRLSVFYVNSGAFAAAGTSDRLGDEQQFRIDLVTPSAPLDSLAKEHLLAAIYEAKPADPPRLEPIDVTVDLSRWAGQSVRLRITSADNQGPLRAGVDEIRFERLDR